MTFKILKTTLKLEKNQLRLLRLLTHISKNIYNLSLYHLRQNYFKTGELLEVKELKDLVYQNPNTKFLETYQISVIIFSVLSAMKEYVKYYNFDGSIKRFYERNEYAKNVCFPKYKRKNDFLSVQFGNMKITSDKRNRKTIIPLSYLMRTGRVFNYHFEDLLIQKFIKASHLKGEQKFEILIPRRLYKKTIKQIKIVPKENGSIFEIQFLYLEEDQKTKLKTEGETLAIDFGITNLATGIITNNKSFIIDGKKLKSILRLYNKQIGKAQAELPYSPILKRKLKTSKRIGILYYKLNNSIENYLNNAIIKLFKVIKNNDVSKIILGWNEGFKTTGINNKSITKNTLSISNQMFVRIPLCKLKNKIINYAKTVNVRVEIIDESYTSKASFYDNDSFYNHTFSGTRIQRGLYKRNNGMLVNADVNGALNIFRKYVYKSSSNRDQLSFLMSRGIQTPNRIRVLN